jgi:ABC-type transport system substrate-binding protein
VPSNTSAPALQAGEATATTAPAEVATATEAAPTQGSGLYTSYLFATVDEYETFSGSSIDKFNEAPFLAEEVKAGTLPPLDQRLPKDVAVVKTREGSAAQYGGEMHLVGIIDGNTLFTQFTEDMTQSLTTFDVNYNVHPNIVKGWKLSDDQKTLTLYLRQGMKWSDGADFNADDFVFWYEDILLNKELTPEIDPAYMLAEQLMGLKKINDYTLEYTFAEPYVRAVERLLGSTIYTPLTSTNNTFLNTIRMLTRWRSMKAWTRGSKPFNRMATTATIQSPTLNPGYLRN